MNAETALGAAFERAGLNRNEAAFKADVSRYLNNGGNIERAHAMLDEIAGELPGEGQMRCADEAKRLTPSARQPSGDDEGQCSCASHEANGNLPLPSPIERDGSGHANGANVDGQISSAAPVRDSVEDDVSEAARILGRRSYELHGNPASAPPRKPTPRGPSRRALEISAANRAAEVKTIFDRYYTSDNRRWGDVGYHELGSMALDGARARALKDAIGTMEGRNEYATIRTLLSEAAFVAAMKAAVHA